MTRISMRLHWPVEGLKAELKNCKPLRFHIIALLNFDVSTEALLLSAVV
jgi:hypothetical protein